MANATATQLQQLYVAYFGRAADPSGLDYWVGQGTTTKAFAASMYAQDEFKSVNGSLSIELQVNQIYQNLFGRDGDSAGLIYWSNQIRTGALELASIANDLIFAVNNGSSATDKAALTNKTNAATSYTADIRESASALLAYQPKSSSPWVTGDNFATAVTFLKTATSSNAPSAAEVQASVDVIAGNQNNGTTESKTLTLTTGVDETTSGTYSKFDGSLTASGTQTLNSLDSLEGTTGTTDVLNATINSSVTPSKLSGIESVNITAAGTAVAVGLYNATGVTSFASVGTTSSTSFTVNDADHTAITSFKVSDSSAPHTFNFKDSSSTSDSSAFEVSNYTGAGAAHLTIPGIETLTITSAGGTDSNDFELIAAALKTLTIKGTGGIDIDAVDLNTATSTKVTSIDASDLSGYFRVATGALATGTSDLTVTGGSGNDLLDVSLHIANDNSVSGGAGDDKITIALAVDDTVVGGAGTDTLATSTVIAETGNVTGFEKLELTAAVSQDMDHLSANPIFTVIGGNSTSSAFTDASADVTELQLKDGMTGTYTVDRKTDTSSDSIRVDLDGKNDVVAEVVLADEETITFDNSNGGTAEVTTVTAGDATKIVVTGGYEITLDNVTSVNLATLDASAATGSVTFGYDGSEVAGTIASEVAMTVTAGTGGLKALTGAGADTITGGTGDDHFTAAGGADSITGGAGNDTISGGAGNDVLSGGTGADSITTGDGVDNVTGGTGNDTITIAANYTTSDTIDGGDGTDTLAISGTASATIKPTTITSVEQVEFTTVGAGTNTLDLSSTTGVSKLTIENGADIASTITGLETGATVVIEEGADVLQTIDTAAGATLSIDVGVTQVGTAGVTVTDAANVTVTGKVATGDIQQLTLDAVDTTSLTLSTTSTNDLDVGAVTGTDQITSLTMSSAASGGTISAASFADADSLTSITLTGVGGNITMVGATGTNGAGSAEELATITATATAGSNIDLAGAITLDNVDTASGNLTTTITSSANGTDGTTDSSVAFGAMTSTYGAINATTSGDGLTTFDDIVAKGITVTGSGSGGTTITDLTDTAAFSATFTGSGTNTITTSTATTSTSIDGSAASGGNTFVSTATSNVTILGGSGADTLSATGTTASTKVHSVSGGAGNDTITGGAGADTLIGGDGADSITAGAGNDSISGGAGNDTFVFVAADLTGADTVDGGAGTDTANITTATSLTGTAKPTLTSVESVDVEFTAASKTVDASGMASLTSLTLGANGDYTGATINNLPTGVTVTINDNGNDGVTLDTVASASITAKVQETMTGSNLTITDASTVTITNASATTATTTALVLDAVDTTSLTVDAGALAGTLATGDITGTDKLASLTVATSTTSSTATLGTVVDADSLTSLTVTALNANATTGAIGGTGTAEKLAAITVTSTGTGVTANIGALTLDTTDSTTDNALVLTSTANTGSAIDYAAINNQYGSFTEVAISDTTNDIDHAGTITAVAMTITTSGGGHHHYAGKLDASGAVSTTHSGSGNVTFADIDADGTNASVSVVATDLSGNLSALASSSTVATTITGGSGDDTITGGTKADTLTGNDGNDSLTGGEGNDTLTGGAGNDTLKEGAGSGSIIGGAGNDSITAGAGFDTIDAGSGDDTIIMGTNMSISDSVVGGLGNDTLTATVSSATANQKIGTLTGVENGTILFDQTGGSFDATGSITAFTVSPVDADDTIAITNLTSSQTVKVVEDAVEDIGSLDLDYANDATATIEIEDSHDTGALTITDAQTVNITSTGGAATAIGVLTLDGTTNATGAGGTDTFTIDVNTASSATTQTGVFTGAVVKHVTLTTSSTGAALSLGATATFLVDAPELETLTISAGGGGDTADDSDITITAMAGTTAADELTSISITAADGADVTTAALNAAGANLTSITATASTTGSVITVGGAITASSLTTLTASAVSGATVDFSNDLDIGAIGTINLSGAGTINLDDDDSVITTLERINASAVTGSVTIDMTDTVGAVEYTFGTGTNTLTTGKGNDIITLASADGTDVINQNEIGALGQTVTIYNFQAGTATEDVGLSLAGLLANGGGTTAVTALNNYDDGAAVSTDAISFWSVGAAGTIDFDDTAAVNANVLVLGDPLTADDEHAAVDALEASGSYAAIAGSQLTAATGLLVLWSDGTDGYLSVLEINTAVVDGAATADLIGDDVFIFKGVSDADDFTATNFPNIVA